MVRADDTRKVIRLFLVFDLATGEIDVVIQRIINLNELFGLVGLVVGEDLRKLEAATLGLYNFVGIGGGGRGLIAGLSGVVSGVVIFAVLIKTGFLVPDKRGGVFTIKLGVATILASPADRAESVGTIGESEWASAKSESLSIYKVGVGGIGRAGEAQK